MTIDIEALRALHAASTPGTWKWDGNNFVLSDRNHVLQETTFYSDAKFIVAAHNEWLALLDEVEAQKTMREEDYQEIARDNIALKSEVAQLKEDNAEHERFAAYVQAHASSTVGDYDHETAVTQMAEYKARKEKAGD